MTDRIDSLIDNTDREIGWGWLNVVNRLTDDERDIDRAMSDWLVDAVDRGMYAAAVEIADSANEVDAILAMEID